MDENVKNRIKNEIDSNPIMLFMKGNPAAPQCGFSAAVVKILNSYSVPFHTVDVLEDGEVREGIKDFSNWPTIPQLFIKGKFIGGCDIATEMHRRGELADLLNAAVGKH